MPFVKRQKGLLPRFSGFFNGANPGIIEGGGMTDHHILQGDVMDGLRTLPDNCVQCTVTSPPYYNLRNYGVEGQIGLEETFAEQLNEPEEKNENKIN